MRARPTHSLRQLGSQSIILPSSIRPSEEQKKRKPDMKKLGIALIGLIFGLSPLSSAQGVSLEERATALVKAKYLGEQESSSYSASEPIRDGNVLVVIVTRRAAGGPCTINVQFRQSGSILIPPAKCVPGT
jgi:hypothetical protein